MSTFLYYGHRSAPGVWAILGNVHRGGARYLLKLAAEDRPEPARPRSSR